MKSYDDSVFSSGQKLEKLYFSNGGSTNVLKPSAIDSDLFVNVKGILILGRFIGLIPCSGLFKHSYKDLRCSFRSVAALASTFCILLHSFNASLGIANMYGARKTNAAEIATFMTIPIFTFWGLFMYVYFFIRRQQFLDIFEAWAKCNLKLAYTSKDKHLKWVIILLSVVVFGSLTVENVMLHLEYFATLDRGEATNASYLQTYYQKVHGHWNRFIGSHPVLHILAIICHKLTYFGGNYADVLMVVFARALYYKFNALCKAADEFLIQPLLLRLEISEVYTASETDHQAWNQIARDHESLCFVFKAMNNFFSPIIFVSYAINVYFLCMQLLTTISPTSSNQDVINFLYNPWSFIHTIGRIFLLSLCLARVTESAHNVEDVLKRCPMQYYNGQIAKLDNRMSVGPKLGFDGLGCFTVTKSTMLSILNVIFTVEIVLLQGLQGSLVQADSVKLVTKLNPHRVS